MNKLSLGLALLTLSFNTYAHCPTSFKAENLCLMLDENVLYLYDHKAEHNGPYKDLKTSKIDFIKSNGAELKFEHPSRGIYKITSSTQLPNIEIGFNNAGKKELIKVEVEKQK